MGADLVSVTSPGEQEIVDQVITLGNHPAGLAYWFGGFAQSGTTGTTGWTWVDGSAWDYTNWNLGQPSNTPDINRFVVQGGGSPVGGGWFEYCSCDRIVCCWMRGAIIEYSADCNGDGIVDKGQILSGELSDANNNGVPDWAVRITTQPTNQSVGVDQPVYFTVEASSTPNCTTPINYRWQRRNPLVLDDSSPNAWIDLQDGGGFANTGTLSMTILRPTAGLATGYRCKITGGCGCEGAAAGVLYSTVVSYAPACPSDFNNDGSVDGDDVITFFERWDGGC